jgi:S-formylglutathione hydrolase FrmB
VREVWVYLPPCYETSSQRYPVLYALPAFGSTGSQLIAGNRWSPGMAHRLDRLIADGCPPVIAVFPDCFTRWGGSQYLNSPALGNYEDYLCDEMVAAVDQRFRTVAERDARAAFGRSSGGYGALRLSMCRPDVFGAFACQSGDMGFALCYVPDFAPTIASLTAAGSMDAWVERFDSKEKKRDFHAVNVLAMAAAYSPDDTQPFGIRLPFDLATGELIEDVWQRWRDNDPVNMVDTPAHADALRSMSLAFFDCGSRDEYRLHLGLKLMRSRLEALAIEHTAEIFDDNHRSLSYRHDVAVPLLAAAITP